jgi:hypothetical protein
MWPLLSRRGQRLPVEHRKGQGLPLSRGITSEACQINVSVTCFNQLTDKALQYPSDRAAFAIVSANTIG